MPKFRKKPVEIEAELIAIMLDNAKSDWSQLPDWVKSACESGNLIFGAREVYIKTLEGDMRGDFNDWLIRGVNGELYPCKPDIFEKTYDVVGEPVR